MALSFEDRQQKLRAAIEQKFPAASDQWESRAYLVATFDAEAIMQRDGKLWRLPYTLTDGQDVELGDAQLVEVQYEPVGEALAFGRSLDKTGAAWDVRILRFGRSENGWLWTRESADVLLPHLPSAPIGLYVYKRGLEAHADAEAIVAAGGPLVRNVVGDVQKPRIESDGIYAEAHVHEDSAWLRTKLRGFEERGVLGKAIGLSVDALCGWVPVRVAEGSAKWINKVRRVLSVDIVTAPSADGRFIRATAGPSFFKEEDGMRDRLVALIKEHRPQLLEGRVVENLTDTELEGLVGQALKPMVGVAPAAQQQQASTEEPEWARTLRNDLAVRDTQARVTEALTASKLPQPIQDKIRKGFAGRVVEATEIDNAIKDEREVLARLSESGQVRGFGDGRAEVVAMAGDKLQVALDRLFGVTPGGTAVMPGLERVHEAFTAETAARVAESLKPVIEVHKSVGAGPRFRSLREAYVQLTGDADIRGTVGRVSETIDSSTFANAMANSLYRRLLMAYAQVNYGERNIITIGRAEDFREKQIVEVGYFGDIDDVDPETADYQEIAAPGDTKVAYSVNQKGNLLTITRKTIINDDLRVVQRQVDNLGRAFRRTFARFVWNFWINNAVYDGDAVAWFHSNHANLKDDALAALEIADAVTLLENQTEPDSGEKLGLAGGGIGGLGLWLVVPTALRHTAFQENDRQYLDDQFTPNPVRALFGASGERIMVNPLLTDASDWGIFRDPSDIESIVVDFLQGREEPEFFLADQPTVGQAFVADKIQYKGRHEYGGDIANFRGAVKSVVA